MLPRELAARDGPAPRASYDAGRPSFNTPKSLGRVVAEPRLGASPHGRVPGTLRGAKAGTGPGGSSPSAPIDRQPDREGAPLALATLDPDHPAVLLHDRA